MNARRAYALGGTVAVLVYLSMPRGPAAQIVFLAVALSVPAMGLVGRRTRRAVPAYTILVAGLALSAVGEVVDVATSMGGTPPGRGAIDTVFLVAYVVQLSAMMAKHQVHVVSRRRFGWFDAVAVAVAVGAVIATALYQQVFGREQATALDWVTRFGGAVLGVALVITGLRLVAATRGRQHRFVLLTGGFFVQLVTDTVAATWSGYTAGGRLDTLWLVGYVLLGLALLDDATDDEPTVAPTVQTSTEIRHTLVIQAFVALVLVGLMVFEVAHLIAPTTLVVWAGAWAVILVLARSRILGLLRTVGEASDTENQRRLSAMISGSSDVRGLADVDGSIRFLTPSIEALTGVALPDWIGQRFDTMLTRHLDGLDDLALRLQHLRPGEEAAWECTAGTLPSGERRTVQLRIGNETATPGVDGWVISAQDVTDAARLTAELRHQALHDTLTGLPNRSLLVDRIQHALDRARHRDGARFAVVLVDLDDFKSVNDGLGHHRGDDLLRAVAGRLTEAVRPGDTVARLGGDEFALLFDDVDTAEAMALAEGVRAHLARPVAVPTGDLTIGASIGVACAGAAADPVALLRAADLAMYESKRGGTAKVTLFDERMHEVAQQQLDLRMELAGALDRGELRVVYQPIVDTRRQRAAGAEALVRWQHPRRGFVSPVDFIPVAEQSGHIRAIGLWVLRTACTEASRWTGTAASAYISVNVSAAQLTDEAFPDRVLEVLDDTGLAPARLLLEITESMLVSDITRTASALAPLRARGVRVAIDDFGTGYSSLSYLRSLCADVVKIDRSFVDGMSANRDNEALTRSIISLAASLGMSTIAEGVETALDYGALTALDCPYVQGYLFSKPVDPATLAGLFESIDASTAVPTTAPVTR